MLDGELVAHRPQDELGIAFGSLRPTRCAAPREWTHADLKRGALHCERERNSGSFLHARARVYEGFLRRDPDVVDLVDVLPRHPATAYPVRPLTDVRYLVVHHTGAPREVDARAIAAEHVGTNGWPGIGYHYLVDAEGTVFRTQDLTTVSYHARQFNPVAVGIAVTGELSAGLPTTEQMASLGELLAMLLSDLGLGVWSIRGHREMVGTPCPGDTFLAVWKPRLLRQVAAWLDPGAITAAPEVSVLLPCNLCVAVERGRTVVRAMNPASVMEKLGNPALAPVGEEVGAALRRVVAAIAG